MDQFEPLRPRDTERTSRAAGKRTPPKKRSRSSAHTSDQATPRPRRRVPKAEPRTGTRSSTSRPTRPARRKPAAEKTGVHPRLKVALVIGAASVLTLVLGGVITYASMSQGLPDPTKPLRGTDQTTRVYDRSGNVITKLYAEQNRTQVPLAEIPLILRRAVIATEDERYYEHKGIDPIALARALLVDVRSGKGLQGGSTITQQYVKNAFVTPERTAKRKAQEAILAYRVEKRYTKDEILGMYLNTIYFGHGAYGVEAAAQTYFGKHVRDIDTAEAAMLAGVIKSPGRYSPYLDPKAAKGRRATVLAQMAEQGYVSKRLKRTSSRAGFNLAGLKRGEAVAPYFMEYVKSLVTEKYGSEAVYRGGLKVHTTLDSEMQRAAERAIADVLDRPEDPSAALVALDPKTGEIRALVGGRSFKTQQFDVAVKGRRQPGSVFKPFVLLTALEKGISPEKTFDSSAGRFAVSGEKPWSVNGSRRGGKMRLREATAESVNSVYARLIMDLGAEKVAGTAKDLGIQTPITPVPAIALGGLKEGVNPLEMAAAYGTLANMGVRIDPTPIANVEDAKGTSVWKSDRKRKRVIDAATAYLTTDILKGVIEEKGATGTGADIGRPAAGKTGTTQEYRDAWFVGYTPDLVCAVWVGYPDSQKEMRSVHGGPVTGGSLPADIWASFMRKASSAFPKHDFEEPDGLAHVRYCRETGLRATKYCPETSGGLFLDEHVPKRCNVHTTPTSIDIPKLAGLTKEVALALLKKLFLQSKVVEQASTDVAEGNVISQTPEAGSKGTTQTVVTIVVSKGTPKSTPPVATFSFDKAKPRKATRFDASASSDDGRVVDWVWEFGDGTQGKGEVLDHTFTSPGTFEVTLWVTDDTGQVSSVTKSVVVK